MIRLITNLEGKTNNRGNIHLNTDITAQNMNEEERKNVMLYVIITQYSLNTGLMKF